jgi:hypothetical protein
VTYRHDSDIADLSFESVGIMTSINSTNTPVTIGILKLICYNVASVSARIVYSKFQKA